MPVLAVGMHKGGVGKTTTVINLAAGLADKGHRVLAVDMDPQAQLGLALGVKVRADRTLVQVLYEDLPLEETIIPARGFHIAPAHSDLASADVQLKEKMNGWFATASALASARTTYDWILLDTPPHIGMLTDNALAAANFVLIPVETQQAAFDQVGVFVARIDKVRQRLNQQLQILGILPTKYARRQTLDDQILDLLRKNPWNAPVFDPVQRSTHFAECFSIGKPIYDHNRNVAGGYEHLVDFLDALSPIKAA